MFDVPILFIVYNRPNLTRIVYEEIKKIKPKQLYIAFDGPKEEVSNDLEKCMLVRQLFQDSIDWDCKVYTLYQIKNLGGKWGGYTAIKWFFENVKEGIILEDDDVPDQSFFPFCQELLEKYRNDARIGTISGDNFQFGRNKTQDSYYFSKYLHGWGWATWKRVWESFDIYLTDWLEKRNTDWIGDFLDDPKEYPFWTSTLDRMYSGTKDAWDYQFSYCLWKNYMLNIIPNNNLITNIGFEGTHSHNPMVNQKRESMRFPLVHPDKIKRNIPADVYTLRYYL